MHLEGTAIGALNVYADQPRAWTDDEVNAAQLLADMATAYVVMVGQLRSAEQLAEQLQHALDSRVIIEQAKGVLATARDIDISAAFELLRRHARNGNPTRSPPRSSTERSASERFLAGPVPGGFDGTVELKATVTDASIVDPTCGETLAGQTVPTPTRRGRARRQRRSPGPRSPAPPT